jgi:hypothetical protein
MNHLVSVLFIPSVTNANMQRKNIRIRLGVFLMIFSGVFFGITLIIPLLDLPVRVKVVSATVSLVLMEVVFWSGGLLVGKELFGRYKQRLNPVNWFKKKGSVV